MSTPSSTRVCPQFTVIDGVRVRFAESGEGSQDASDEDPFIKIEDVKNAVTFLAGHDTIDPGRLAAVASAQAAGTRRPPRSPTGASRPSPPSAACPTCGPRSKPPATGGRS